jgi:ABC-type transport system involved in cytochrome bd biosynthesis fused ATPase/permease subunit
MRTPNNLPEGLTHHQYALQLRDVVMAVFGLSHTVNTRVGDDFLRGVSGGERKRVTIAEAALCGAPLQCWDNSTRGLDSANSIKFCQTLRMQSDIMKTTSLVAIYQAPQDAYDVSWPIPKEHRSEPDNGRDSKADGYWYSSLTRSRSSTKAARYIMAVEKMQKRTLKNLDFPVLHDKLLQIFLHP